MRSRYAGSVDRSIAGVVARSGLNGDIIFGACLFRTAWRRRRSRSSLDILAYPASACTCSSDIVFTRPISFFHFASGLGEGSEEHQEGSLVSVTGEFRMCADVMDTTRLRSAPMGDTAFMCSEALKGCDPRAKDNDTEP